MTLVPVRFCSILVHMRSIFIKLSLLTAYISGSLYLSACGEAALEVAANSARAEEGIAAMALRTEQATGIGVLEAEAISPATHRGGSALSWGGELGAERVNQTLLEQAARLQRLETALTTERARRPFIAAGAAAVGGIVVGDVVYWVDQQKPMSESEKCLTSIEKFRQAKDRLDASSPLFEESLRYVNSLGDKAQVDCR